MTKEEHEKYVDMRNAGYRKRSNRNRTINYFTGFDDGFKQAKKQFTRQIDKMKCCPNCDNYDEPELCAECKDKSKWELKE